MAKFVPTQNYIGLLQETCLKLSLSRPEYNEDSNDCSKLFKCYCNVAKYSASGQGFSKKMAKQNAAKKVLKLIEKDNTLVVDVNSKKNSANVVTMLEIYSVKNNDGKPPLYADKPKEGDLFVVECTLKGYTATGKGKNKRSAKERAADIVAHEFEVHKYYENIGKTRQRKESLKNPVSLLHELAQKEKLYLSYNEDSSTSEFSFAYRMGGITTVSSVCSAKKNAKVEAALKMLEKYSDPTVSYLNHQFSE